MSAMATVRARLRRPAVISATQSRQPRRSSWPASQVNVAGRLTGSDRLRRRLGDQREEGIFQAGGGFPGLAVQFVERAFGDQAPAGDDADAVGHALGDFENMRGHDDGAAGGDALAQHVLDLARRAGIEPGQRLVEDDELGIVHQRAGERHLLPHALGKSLAALMRVRLKSEPVDQFARTRFRSCGVDAPEPGDEFEIFERRELVVDHRLVRQPGDDLLGGDRIG